MLVIHTGLAIIDCIFRGGTKTMADSVAHIPAVMNRIEDAVFRIGTESGPEDLLKSEALPVSGRGMYVLTNSEGAYGASALFYPGVKEKVSEVIGGDYYVLPSSIHEVLILKDTPDLDSKELVQMVKELAEIMIGKTLTLTTIKNAKFLIAVQPNDTEYCINIKIKKQEGNICSFQSIISDIEDNTYAKISLQTAIEK